MKIMSLNVNQFRVLRLSEGCWAKEVVEFAKKFLKEDVNNAVFLYEVPYYTGFNEHYYGILELFNDFVHEFESYDVNYPKERAYFCTLAITNRGSRWKLAGAENRFKVEDNGKEVYKNRFVELIYINGGEESIRVLAVHAKLNDEFLTALVKHSQAIASTKSIILGDFNCHRGEASSHKADLVEMEKHLYDLVKDTDVTYFPGGTTIDHVLISKELKGNVAANVVPQVVLELSDHAVIIVDIKE